MFRSTAFSYIYNTIQSSLERVTIPAALDLHRCEGLMAKYPELSLRSFSPQARVMQGVKVGQEIIRLR